MLLAAILFVGAFNRRNAALAGAPLATRPTGALRITRHPMNWAFAIWAVVHGALAGRTATLVLTGAIFTLAIVGSALQEVKKRRADPGWANYARQTSFFPFAKGRFWPGAVPVVGGILIIILASWLHPQLGAPAIPPLVWFT